MAGAALSHDGFGSMFSDRGTAFRRWCVTAGTEETASEFVKSCRVSSGLCSNSDRKACNRNIDDDDDVDDDAVVFVTATEEKDLLTL